MKKLHKLVLQTFIGPFLATFVISNFLLLMIWMVKYLEDIIGKGLDVMVIVEMMARGSLNQIPFSLPLAMLLSSIMTYGKLGESIELTAMKSLGVSLWKAMLPVFTCSLLLGIGAFFFTNNYLPYSNKKLKSLVRDIRFSKPELLIPEGVFYNQLQGYTIRIGKKNEDKTIKDVLIFDDSNTGAGGFIAADSGKLELSESGDFLILNLYDGNTYKPDKEPVKPGFQRRLPLVKNKFEYNRLMFDLSGFKFERSGPSKGKSTKEMSVSELMKGIDSLKVEIKEEYERAFERLNNKYLFREDTSFTFDTLQAIPFHPDSLIASLDSNEIRLLYKSVLHQVKNAQLSVVQGLENNMSNRMKFLDQHWTAWHKMFAIGVVSIIMFLIGAPFGAIVRKGGLGLPVVIGVLLFLFYYVLSTSLEKVARKGEFDPFLAVWLAPMILTPIGLFLSYKAASDSALFRFEAYKKFFKRLFSRNKAK